MFILDKIFLVIRAFLGVIYKGLEYNIGALISLVLMLVFSFEYLGVALINCVAFLSRLVSVLLGFVLAFLFRLLKLLVLFLYLCFYASYLFFAKTLVILFFIAKAIIFWIGGFFLSAFNSLKYLRYGLYTRLFRAKLFIFSRLSRFGYYKFVYSSGKLLLKVYTSCKQVIVIIWSGINSFVGYIHIFGKYVRLMFTKISGVRTHFKQDTANKAYVTFEHSAFMEFSLKVAEYFWGLVFWICKETIQIMCFLTRLTRSFVSYILLNIFIYNVQAICQSRVYALRGLSVILIFIVTMLSFEHHLNKRNTLLGTLVSDNRTSISVFYNFVVHLVDSELFRPIRYYTLQIETSGAEVYDSLLKEQIEQSVVEDVNGKIKRFYHNMADNFIMHTELEINRDEPYKKLKKLSFVIDNNKSLVVENIGDKQYEVRTVERQVSKYILKRIVTISGSIYKTLANNDIHPNVITTISQVLSYALDFQRDIRDNDRLEFIYSCNYSQDGVIVDCDKLLYLSFQGQKTALTIYNYQDDFYYEDGSSVVTALIKTPVLGVELSSPFGNRRHPILGYNKLHTGIDFSAPTGTPIYASGDGVIEYIGWAGSYGYFISIRHNEYLHTAYAHMSKFAPNLKKNSKVKQLQVIGYVGNTGRSTGSHLHYEVLIKRKVANPSTIKMPPYSKIEEESLKLFQANVFAIKGLAIKTPSTGRAPYSLLEDRTRLASAIDV